MPLENEVLLQIEEMKELGHEYRYREQVMVQEMGLSMVAIGVLIQAIAIRPGTVTGFMIQIVGLVFLALLSLHLRNTNQDRKNALDLKEVLRKQLKFGAVHLGVDGESKRGVITMSAPKNHGTLCILTNYSVGGMDDCRVRQVI